MHIDRYMVNLFFEIKRNSPAKYNGSLKISDPTLGQTLIDLYQISDEANQRLIEVFLERAGEDWSKQLRSNDGGLLSKLQLRNTRSAQTAETTNTPAETKTRPHNEPKKKRYYRGALVEV